MSKDKPSKKDKLRKYDLFSIMLEQSSVFRDMVKRFQGAFGFPPEPQAPPVAEPVVTPSKPRKGVKTNKRAKATAGAKSNAAKKAPRNVVKARAVAAASANPAPAAKKDPKKVAAPAKKAPGESAPKAVTKKLPVKTAKKAARQKAVASKK